MTPPRPYLLRAFLEWINDNLMTPFISVDALAKGVVVPQQYVENGRIILNISDEAIEHLVIDNRELVFRAEFAGISHMIVVPIKAISAIYAKETGRGMFFTPEDAEGEELPFRAKPVLHTDNTDNADKEEMRPLQRGGRARLRVVPKNPDHDPDDSDGYPS